MRSPPRFVVVVVALFGLALALQACPGAQVKDGPSGDIDIVLRRVDVVKAGFDQMEVRVIVAVNNGTNSDVDVEASCDLALVGPGSPDGDGEGGGAESAGEGEAEEAAVDDDAAPAETASGLDGSRHKGTGSGTAVANNTSELPITIILPLPSDPAVLEQVLSWKKAKVHIAGKVKAGFLERTIAGERDVATPQLPEFKLKSAQVAKVDDGAAGEAFFTFLFDNRNSFDVVVDKVGWKISIRDKELRTKEADATKLPGSAVEEYTESVILNEKDFPLKELKTMLKQPSVSYIVEANFEVRGIKKDVMFKGDMQFPR
jgi:hypothetical protein